MKITVWGINFDPEPTGIGPFNTDMCAYMAEHGHDVMMVSTFPYYPWWKKRDADRGKLYESSRHGAVKLYRCWHYVPAKPSTIKRLVHELSFVVTSTLRALFLPSPDIYVVVSPSLFLGAGAFIVSRLKRRPFVFHVQDLQPDAALGLGMIKPGLSVKLLYALEKWTYRRAAVVSGISQGMMDAYKRKQISADKTYLFPNWIPDESPGSVSPVPNGASFRAANGIAADKPLIAYSGNIGNKQGLEVVVEAAVLDRSQTGAETAHWAICGEGAAKPALQALIEKSGCKQTCLYPLQPDDLYQALLREADVNLIAQQKGTGQFFFPSKLLSILQYGRPVLAVADETSELARAVQAGDFGIVVPCGDAAALHRAAMTIVTASDEQKKTWARNGRAWVGQFRRSKVLGDFTRRLSSFAEPKSIRIN